MNILILSCGTRSLLVDYFMDRENGFDKVVVTDCSSYSPALYRADKYYLVPRINDVNYIPIIFEICDKEEINAVLPLQEDELVLISNHRRDFISKGILPIISSSKSVSLCRDKSLFADEMEKKGIITVPTYTVDLVNELISRYYFPIFMKPRFGAGSVSSYIIKEENALLFCLKNDDMEFIFQPYLQGREYGVNAYVDIISGKLVELFIMNKIRMRSGETEKSISLHNEKIKSIVEKIIANLSLIGPIDIDIIEKDGVYYVLEINPRFGGGYPNTHECGVNFIKLLSNNLMKKENKPFDMEYEDDIVAFRYMTISTMRRRSMPNEK